MPTVNAIPVAPGLFTWPTDAPELIGSKCGSCGLMTFPTQRECPRCVDGTMADATYSRRGTLWTFTTQEFPPKSPPYAKSTSEFRPYAIGYVEFEGQGRVEGLLDVDDFSSLRIGMEMEVVAIPFHHTDDGTPTVTYAFRPVG